MDEDRVERRFACVFAGGENHAGHPEEDDVVARDQHVGGVVVLKVLGVVRPAQSGEGPKGGGKPGIQHVILLPDLLGMTVAAFCGVAFRDGNFAAVLAGPGGNPVPPP